MCLKECPTEDSIVLDCMVNSVVESCESKNSADNTKAVQIYDTMPG